MRRRHLLLVSCIALPVTIGAYAQAEAERQFDAAVARLRAELGPEGAVEWQRRSIDPVSGTVRIEGLSVRKGTDRLSIAEASLSDLRQDRIGRASFSGLRMEGAPRQGDSHRTTLSAGRITLDALLLPAGRDGAVNWAAAAVEGAVAEGFRAEVENRGEAAIGRFTISGYQPGALREVVMEGFRFADNTDGSTRMQLGRARLAGTVLPRIGQPFDPWGLAADAVLLEGVEISTEKRGATIHLGRVQIDGWGEGRLTTLAAEGLGTTGNAPKTGDFTVELGRLGFSGVAARDIAYAHLHDRNPPLPVPSQDQDGLLEGLSISLGGAPLLRIGAVRGRNSWDPAAPDTQIGTASLEGLALDLPGEYGGAWLDALGFKSILGRMELGTRLIPQDGRMIVDPFTIEATGMGRLGFTMDMRGIEMPPPGQPSMAKDDPFALMARWSVAGLAIRYTDEGLLQAMLVQQATRERVTEQQLQDRYARMMLRAPVSGSARGKEPPAIRQIREALAAFARNLGTIEIAMRPPAPVPLLDLAGLAALPGERTVRELNITVTSTVPGTGSSGEKPPPL
ncbi:hypothetical protein [Roseomonas xinghualingensis]|uniref:hypothetical protein n=1 Tax=Roseomonas xinghualingensis TaxID=2986475 RepID=UPI0021F24BD0|nr:hypothetical protein [Roseomonas sp. SXEYE001]MCV4207100.1 hypothetical protein [Roseomonas sp. SXEYE001]